METCKIQWIDSEGNLTPDNNPAIAYIRTTFADLSKITGKYHAPSETFPCCAMHLKRLAGDWEIVNMVELPETD